MASDVRSQADQAVPSMNITTLILPI